MCLLQAGGEVRSGGAGDEVVVGILPGRQPDDIGAHAGALQVLCELASSALAGMVFIPVKNDVDGIPQSAACQVLDRLRMAVELESNEGGGLLQQLYRACGERQFLLEMRNTLPNGRSKRSSTRRIKSPPRPRP
jgi:hypothetical protein